MATWASVPPNQQAQVQNYVDQDLRPALLTLARALARANIAVLPQYLASPSGQASTLAAPAADSVAGIVATLSAGEMVPVLTSSLALIGPVLGSKVASYTTALNTLIGTNFTTAIQQDLAQFVGSPNLING
jgi:hypothetical protein